MSFKVFKAEYRAAGTLTAKETYQVGKSAAHALEEIKKRLEAKIGIRFELSEAVEIEQRFLPEDAKLFETLRKQREAPEPAPEIAPQDAPFFLFFIDRGASRKKIKLWYLLGALRSFRRNSDNFC